MCRLLVSVTSVEEAVEALRGGAEIIDVKNPAEGALGAPSPRILSAIVKRVPPSVEVSAAVGDVPNLPGTVALACAGAAACGARYVKVGLYGTKRPEEALRVCEAAAEALACFDGVKLVVAGYADWARVGSINVLSVPSIAARVGANVVMVDTKIKDGKTSFEFLGRGGILRFIEEGHALGLKVAIAGSLGPREVGEACVLGADIVGVRSAACRGGRVKGRVDAAKVAALAEAVRAALALNASR